jgi:hypothetical protein
MSSLAPGLVGIIVVASILVLIAFAGAGVALKWMKFYKVSFIVALERRPVRTESLGKLPS